MAQTTPELTAAIAELVASLQHEGIVVEQVWLHGSYAEHPLAAENDIDLVVISKDFAALTPIARLELLSQCAWRNPLPLEILGYTPAEMMAAKDSSVFLDRLTHRGYIVYDHPN